MPYPNEHAARLKNPNNFQPNSFRRIRIANGIQAIIGKLKGKTSTTTQAYRFDKDKFTVSEAKAWLKEHNINYIMFEPASNVQAFSASIKVNLAGLKNAKSLISSGKIDENSSWSFVASDENKILGNNNWNEYSKWHLAIDTSANPDTKAHYKYAFGKNGKLYRSALRAIRTRAGQQGQNNISEVAGKLFDQLKQKVEAFETELNLFSRILSFTQADIIANIPVNVLAKIKEKDSHPFFTMYSICHEGTSSPVIVGEKSQPITWTKKAIESIKNIITKGVKLFKGHNEDGSHTGRRVIGNVIHSFEKEINGVLHHLVIAYHKPDVVKEVEDYDVCSQEAKWNIFNVAGKLIADTIEKLTGIALGNSREETPAFRDAKRLAYVQAFESVGETDNNSSGEDENIILGEKNMANGKTKNLDQINDNLDVDIDDDYTDDVNQNQNNQRNVPKTKRRNNGANEIIREKVLTYKELKEEIKRLGVYPHQLFDKEDIKRDREFVTIFNENEVLKEKLEQTEGKIKDLTRTAALSTANNRIIDTITKNKIPSKIADFIKDSFESRKDSLTDLSDEGIGKFVEDQTKLFQQVSRVIDPDFDIKRTDSDKNNADSKDYTKKENNELLSEDLEEY